MSKVLLGVTGSVAAIKTPQLADALTEAGHEVRVVSTRSAAHFFRPEELGSVPLFRDEDEWPEAGYRRGDEVLHIDLRRWADLLVIAPLSANTLAKLANGICDNCLSCVWRAWDLSKPVVLAPAMNTLMWEHPFTSRHMRSLACDFGAGHAPGHLDNSQVIDLINERSPNLRVVPPVSKQLACGDVGIGAMGEIASVVRMVGSLTDH